MFLYFRHTFLSSPQEIILAQVGTVEFFHYHKNLTPKSAKKNPNCYFEKYSKKKRYNAKAMPKRFH